MPVLGRGSELSPSLGQGEAGGGVRALSFYPSAGPLTLSALLLKKERTWASSGVTWNF